MPIIQLVYSLYWFKHRASFICLLIVYVLINYTKSLFQCTYILSFLFSILFWESSNISYKSSRVSKMSKIVKFLELRCESIRTVLKALFETLIVSSSINFLTLFGTPTNIFRYWPGFLCESHFWCSSTLICLENSFWIFTSIPLEWGSAYNALSSLQTSTTT